MYHLSAITRTERFDPGDKQQDDLQSYDFWLLDREYICWREDQWRAAYLVVNAGSATDISAAPIMGPAVRFGAGLQLLPAIARVRHYAGVGNPLLRVRVGHQSGNLG